MHRRKDGSSRMPMTAEEMIENIPRFESSDEQIQDVKVALNAEKMGVQMSLFVRKNKDDKTSKEFYYLGKIKATGNTREFLMPNTQKNAVEIEYHLDTPIKEDIYEYLIQ